MAGRCHGQEERAHAEEGGVQSVLLASLRLREKLLLYSTVKVADHGEGETKSKKASSIQIENNKDVGLFLQLYPAFFAIRPLRTSVSLGGGMTGVTAVTGDDSAC